MNLQVTLVYVQDLVRAQTTILRWPVISIQVKQASREQTNVASEVILEPCMNRIPVVATIGNIFIDYGVKSG